MRHSFLAPTRRDALRLQYEIDAVGWYARVIQLGAGPNRRTAVIIHAPAHVVSIACRRAHFSPGVKP